MVSAGSIEITRASKIISELRIESDNLRLKGMIDQVHVYDNDYVPFELKTSTMAERRCVAIAQGTDSGLFIAFAGEVQQACDGRLCVLS